MAVDVDVGRCMVPDKPVMNVRCLVIAAGSLIFVSHGMAEEVRVLRQRTPVPSAPESPNRPPPPLLVPLPRNEELLHIQPAPAVRCCRYVALRRRNSTRSPRSMKGHR